VRDQPAAVAEQHHHVDAREKADRRRKQAHPPEDAVLLREHGVVGRVELRAVFGLAAEALGHRDALDALGEDLHHALHQVRLCAYSGWILRENHAAMSHSTGVVARQASGERRAAGSPCR
jgi:hypothetical protein